MVNFLWATLYDVVVVSTQSAWTVASTPVYGLNEECELARLICGPTDLLKTTGSDLHEFPRGTKDMAVRPPIVFLAQLCRVVAGLGLCR